jgi:EmrB/QacA subfamily drug resistance transporter
MASTVQPTPAADPAPVSPRKLFFALFPSIMLPMFLAQIDQTIVATALPAMAASLGNVEGISWVVVSYLIATTIAAPVYGRLGDMFGRKRLLLAALLIFIVASMLCVWSSSLMMLTAARVLQGLGGGGLMTLSQAMIGETVPIRERGRYQGWLATVGMTSATFGPVAGGWLTEHFGWHSIFLINVPLGLLAMVMVIRLPDRATGGGKLNFDVIGVVLFTLFIAPALLAVEQLQHFDARALPSALLLAGIAAGSLILLMRQERRASMPLLPIALLRDATIWRADVIAACVGGVLVGLLTFLPIYLEVVRGTSPSQTGLVLLPLTAFIAIGSMVTGRLITKTGHLAVFPSFGLPVVVIALTVLALFAGDMSVWHLPYLFALIALVHGTAMPVVQTTVQLVAGRKHLGMAAASVQFSRSIGAAIGTALAGAVLFAVLAATDSQTAHLFSRIVEQGPAALAGMSPQRIAVVQDEIASAFRATFLAIAAIAGLGAVMAWTMPVRRIPPY